MTRRGSGRSVRARSAAAREAADICSSRAGFTLISVIIAVVLLTIGLMALSRTQTALLATQATMSSRSSALEIGRAYMEEVRARDPWTVTSEGVTRLRLDGTPGADGPFRRSLSVTETESNLLRVAVLIADNRGGRPIELVTYIYRGAR